MEKPTLLLITPPLTQLNTPYPATAYLKGYLEKVGYTVFQADLGIELVLKIFSKNGLSLIFEEINNEFDVFDLEIHHRKMIHLQNDYLHTIERTILFLQNQDPTLAHSICSLEFLPQGKRFESQLEKAEYAFGGLDIQDKARFIATLYLEDLGDLIRETIAPEFEFSRYAEKLGLSATSFDPLHEHLQQENGLLDHFLLELLDDHIEQSKPELIGFSVPFPGNLYGAFKCAQYVKANYPNIYITMGGGYPNTELRELKDPRVFEYVDFITLDDGEGPIVKLLEFVEGKRNHKGLQRTFCLLNDEVTFLDSSIDNFIPHSEIGTPNYKGLPIKKYLSVIDVLNPMHRLWSDGRWNKLTIAHGCYWKKCSFCDISLDYIGRYDVAPATLLVDRIEEIIEQTGETGFHFVDEAAPPLAMRDLAIELIKRNVKISWWANIRFEKTFTAELSILLAKSGCIAVSGGLEVASDRLLTLMEKGVTIDQVARVTHGFTQAGIMVHAYLMYGFPTQTAQETIDSLEIVRQLFEENIIQSAYWHQLSMTEHSPIGKNPEKYGVKKVGPEKGLFANNDLIHEDPTGCKHHLFSEGLKTSLYNYMHGMGLEYNPQEWFEFRTPPISISQTVIKQAIHLQKGNDLELKNHKIIWTGALPEFYIYETSKKGKKSQKACFTFFTKQETIEIITEVEFGEMLFDIFPRFLISTNETITIEQFKEIIENQQDSNLKKVIKSDFWRTLRKKGLLLIR